MVIKTQHFSILATAAATALAVITGLFVEADAAEPWQLMFQEPATPIMEGIIDLHNQVFFFLIVIFVVTGWFWLRILMRFNAKANPVPSTMSHNAVLEIIWTVAPSLILAVIAIPTFGLLYAMDEVVDPSITIKAIGHQWYWSYEYSDYNTSDEDSLAFDSYMIPEEDLQKGELRLLEVDNRVVLPTHTHIRILTTSTDVIHCWTIPSFGVKADSVPGRLNQMGLYIKREGVYYGQCSELCGVNHGFMPIVVEAVPLEDYITWVSTKLAE
jgi:cytochrome c oxidase subunit 2